MGKAKTEKRIAVACKTSDCLPWRSIKPLQGNYKRRTKEDIEKITKSIKNYGFAFPAFVSKIGADNWCLDAHGRLLALEQLEKDGWIIPPIPVVYINAKTKEEAKQLLLRCDSRYGTVDKDGFREFVEDIEVAVEDLSIHEIVVETGPEKEVVYKEKVQLIIDFETEDKAEALYNELKGRGLKIKISTL